MPAVHLFLPCELAGLEIWQISIWDVNQTMIQSNPPYVGGRSWDNLRLKMPFFNEHVGGRCSGYVNLFHPFHGTGSQNYPGPILHIYIYCIFGEAFPVSCFQRGLAWLTKLPFVVCRVFVSIFQQALHHL